MDPLHGPGPDPRQYSAQTGSGGIPPGAQGGSISISPTDSTTSAKKRRTTTTTTAGSRGVANLTPDQLAKKRANDREAQRAIRERTKSQIETLERRIQELTSQQPYLELQHALRQKELVEAENDEIRKRLNDVLHLLQPLVSGQPVLGGNALIGMTSILRNSTQHWRLTTRRPKPESPS